MNHLSQLRVESKLREVAGDGPVPPWCVAPWMSVVTPVFFLSPERILEHKARMTRIGPEKDDPSYHWN